MAYINNKINIMCDAPKAWGMYFQDSASPQMEALVELHDNIMFYLVIILFAVGWIMVSIVRNYVRNKISNKYMNHGTLIELVWTVTPALILILIAFPSFKLLYLMDEVTDPNLTVFAEGHQWYWSYQYPDFLSDDNEELEFDSYLVPESDLEDGKLRMLEVDNRVILPEITHTRFIVSSGDVIHSYACPSLGIKCDAYPGRLNQVSVLVNREGIFFGQCSEICGILHSSMPITIECVKLENFLAWLQEQVLFTPLSLLGYKRSFSTTTIRNIEDPVPSRSKGKQKAQDLEGTIHKFTEDNSNLNDRVDQATRKLFDTKQTSNEVNIKLLDLESKRDRIGDNIMSVQEDMPQNKEFFNLHLEKVQSECLINKEIVETVKENSLPGDYSHLDDLDKDLNDKLVMKVQLKDALDAAPSEQFPQSGMDSSSDPNAASPSSQLPESVEDASNFIPIVLAESSICLRVIALFTTIAIKYKTQLQCCILYYFYKMFK